MLRISDSLVRFIAQTIQCRFQFHPLRLEISPGRGPRDRDGLAPQKTCPTEGTRHFKLIPAPEEFFFEAAKVTGIIGKPVSFANSTVPNCAMHRGPRGPSGVTARSVPDRPSRTNSLRALTPPRVVDPRTDWSPNRRMIRWINSPSRCSLIKAWTPGPL